MKKIITFAVGVVTAFVMVAVAPYVMKQFFDNSENQAKAFYSFVKNTGCFENYNNWNNSANRKNDPDWNLYYVPFGIQNNNNGSDPYKMMEQYLDVNGDGLNDYIYYADQTSSNAQNINERYECVYLNSGRGWQKAYSCVKNIIYINGNPAVRYYGDCAG